MWNEQYIFKFLYQSNDNFIFGKTIDFLKEIYYFRD